MNRNMSIETVLYQHFSDMIAISGRNDKMDFVSEKIVEDALFEQTIIFLCDKQVITNLASKKMKKKLTVEPEVILNDYIDFLLFIQSGLTGTDKDIASVQTYINQFHDNVKEFLLLVATKNLKTGMTLSTLNKILKELGKETVFEMKVQLAEAFNKIEKKELVKDPNYLGVFYLTQKLDGIRSIAFKENGTVKFYSRGGKEQVGFYDIRTALLHSNYPDNTVYDGEFLKVNPNNLSSGELYRETMKIVAKDGEKKDIQYHIFDMLPISEFKKGISKLKYSQRREQLDSLPNKQWIEILTVLYKGTDVSVIKTLGMKLIEEGKEGIMLNTDDVYKAKRVKSVLKVKQLLSSDAIIKGVYEGTNKNKGKLGGLQMTYHDIIVNVGSGFSDSERVEFWENPDKIIGTIGTYEYTEPSENQEGKPDIRFARWKGLRPDKGIKDVSYDN